MSQLDLRFRNQKEQQWKGRLYLANMSHSGSYLSKYQELQWDPNLAGNTVESRFILPFHRGHINNQRSNRQEQGQGLSHQVNQWSRQSRFSGFCQNFLQNCRSGALTTLSAQEIGSVVSHPYVDRWFQLASVHSLGLQWYYRSHGATHLWLIRIHHIQKQHRRKGRMYLANSRIILWRWNTCKSLEIRKVPN